MSAPQTPSGRESSPVTPAARQKGARRWQRRLGAMAVVQFLLLPALVVGFAPAAAADVIGNNGSGSYTVDLGTFDLEVTSSVTPDNIEPGEPISVKWTVFSTGSSADPGSYCEPGENHTQTGPLDTAIFHKVGPGGSYWNTAPGFEVYHTPITGTQFQRNQWLCDPPRLETVDSWDFVVPGSSTAQLPPGCYHVSVVNQHLHTSANSNGTLAAFTVGEGSCSEVRSITVDSSYAHAGSLKTGLSGRETVEVTGTGVGSIASVCIVSTWTATIKNNKSTTVLWNGGPAENLSPNVSDVQRYSTPTGVAKRESIEQVTETNCFQGTLASVNRSLIVTPPAGQLVGLTYGQKARALDLSGNVLAELSLQSSSSSKSGRITFARSGSNEFNIVL